MDGKDRLLSRPERNRITERGLTSDGWAETDPLSPDEPFAGELAAGVTSLGFIRAALRRRARLWCALAVIGLVAGAGLFVMRPAGYGATVQLLIANPPGSPQGVAVQNDQGFVQSLPVATGAVGKLRLHESPATFLASYTATVQTDQILLITVNKAPTVTLAMSEVSAVANSFLAFQRTLLTTQAESVNTSLQQQITQDEDQLNTLVKRIGQVSAEPGSPARQTQLKSLNAERTKESNDLLALQTAVSNNKAAADVAITTALKQSEVLGSATPVVASRKKRLALYGGGGLLAGLAIGLAIVVIGAVASDKLRRRDDIARALGVPVRISVGKLALGRGQPLASAVANADIRRIVEHLDGAVAGQHNAEPTAIAVVPADDIKLPAACSAALAVWSARRGKRVVVTDLSIGAPVARLLGSSGSGIQQVSAADISLVVAVPNADEAAPAGPLQPLSGQTLSKDELSAACASADLLVAFVPLDPALGGDHLAGWARSAVVMVTAGQSTAERLHAVGEMVRLSGVTLAAGVLLGADKSDESLGVIYTAEPLSSSASVPPLAQRTGADPAVAKFAPRPASYAADMADRYRQGEETSFREPPLRESLREQPTREAPLPDATSREGSHRRRHGTDVR